MNLKKGIFLIIAGLLLSSMSFASYSPLTEKSEYSYNDVFYFDCEYNRPLLTSKPASDDAPPAGPGIDPG